MRTDCLRLLAGARNLERVDDWLWRSPSIAPVSYPKSGSTTCASLEEGSFWFEHRNGCITHALQSYPPRGVVLDVGGGNGVVARHLEQNGFPTLLLEPSSDGVYTAQARGLSPIVQATLEGAGFSPGTVPAMGLFDVLEHCERDLDLLRLAQSLIIPEGRIYITVPAFHWLWSSEDEHAGHHRRYSLRGLSHRLRKAAFTVEFATYMFAPLLLPLLIVRTIPSCLRLRRGGAIDTAHREHGLAGGVTTALVRYSLGRELGKLQRGGKIRAGTSCLVVAVKRKN